jgi:hypothetical protein
MFQTPDLEILTEFKLRSQILELAFTWDTTFYVDGMAQFMDIRQALIYQQMLDGQFLSAQIVNRASNAGVTIIDTPLQLAEQFLAISLELEYQIFQDNITYDPELRFQLLFGDPPPGEPSIAWVAAPIVIGAVAVAGVAALVLNPKLRAKVFPFMNRSSADTPSMKMKHPGAENDKKGNGWTRHKPDSVEIRNTG